jgi:hypothetical protein
LVEQLRRLRQLRASEQGLNERTSGSEPQSPINLAGSIDTAYHDPLWPDDSPPVTAAFEPVRVESGPAETRDTGWVVIVQETPLQFSSRAGAESPTPAK